MAQSATAHLNAAFIARIYIHQSKSLRVALLCKRPQVVDVGFFTNSNDDVRFRLFQKLSDVLESETPVTSRH